MSNFYWIVEQSIKKYGWNRVTKNCKVWAGPPILLLVLVSYLYTFSTQNSDFDVFVSCLRILLKNWGLSFSFLPPPLLLNLLVNWSQYSCIFHLHTLLEKFTGTMVLPFVSSSFCPFWVLFLINRVKFAATLLYIA